MADPKKRPPLPTVWREARELLWTHRHRLSLGFALMLLNRAASLVLPASSKFLIDDVIGRQRTDLLMPLAGAALLATIVQTVTSFTLAQLLGVAAQRAISTMRKAVHAHVVSIPIRHFDNTQTGALVSRIMTDADGIRNLVGTGLVDLAGGLVTAAVGLVILFYLNWHMTLITLGVLIVFGAAMALAFSRVRPIFRERSKLNAEVNGRLAESLSGVRVVKAYTAEKREELSFAKGIHRLFRNVRRSMLWVSSITAFTNIIIGIIGALMIVLGGRAIMAGEMTLGDFVMYIFFTGLVAAPLISIANVGTQVTEAFAGLDRIRELRKLATEDQERGDTEPLGAIDGRIEMQNVNFEYVPGVPVLRNISFTAPAGTTTALVGSSGSGKSTLIGLVMAFHRPLSGKILLDGRDLSRIRLRDYRHELGVVLQDNFLFDGTIVDNIRYARPHATLDEVVAAAKIAHADEFIQGFEKKYDTIIGERGVKLSGGQRQRVAIARAILAQPKILILDEATSSLDSESEAMIQDGLNNLRKGRTSFVIAHRLSTIRSADQILVIEQGEIVERGMHPELLAKNGRYKQLYDRQYQLELNRFINPGEDFTPEPARSLSLEGRGPT